MNSLINGILLPSTTSTRVKWLLLWVYLSTLLGRQGCRQWTYPTPPLKYRGLRFWERLKTPPPYVRVTLSLRLRYKGITVLLFKTVVPGRRTPTKTVVTDERKRRETSLLTIRFTLIDIYKGRRGPTGWPMKRRPVWGPKNFRKLSLTITDLKPQWILLLGQRVKKTGGTYSTRELHLEPFSLQVKRNKSKVLWSEKTHTSRVSRWLPFS